MSTSILLPSRPRRVRVASDDSQTGERGAPATVGARLAYYRDRAKLSQAELSRATGVPQSTISLIEAGGSSPRVDTLQQIAPGLGVTVAELLGESVPGLPGAEDLPPEDAVFFRDFQRLSPELRDQMRGFLDVLRATRRHGGAPPAADVSPPPRAPGPKRPAK